MKQSTSCLQLQVLPAILLLCFSCVAQQRQDIPAKEELALEVSNLRAGPWEIPAFDGGGGSAASFGRIKEWKPASMDEIVKSIDFKIGREGELVIAHLSVTLENEKVVEVGLYRLRKNESVNAEELTKFGVEALVLKVVKAKPALKDPLPPIPPQILNKTKAIEVVSFYGRHTAGAADYPRRQRWHRWGLMDAGRSNRLRAAFPRELQRNGRDRRQRQSNLDYRH